MKFYKLAGASVAALCAMSLSSVSLSSPPLHPRCHIYRVWHYPKPQRCFTALASFHVKPTTEKTGNAETFHERIDIPLPEADFTPCPDGDERLLAIAKLRALYESK